MTFIVAILSASQQLQVRILVARMDSILQSTKKLNNEVETYMSNKLR